MTGQLYITVYRKTLAKGNLTNLVKSPKHLRKLTVFSIKMI